MGYTHYFYRKQKLNPEKFNKVVSDFEKVLAEVQNRGIKICGGHGDGDPVVNSKEIWFNGTNEGDQGHETMYIPLEEEKREFEQLDNKKRYFNFCKTARKPYDIAVTACLIIAKHHLGSDVSVSSDGDNDEWSDGKQLCQDVLGYGQDFNIDGDDE